MNHYSLKKAIILFKNKWQQTALIVIVLFFACNPAPPPGPAPQYKTFTNWLDWNVLYKTGSTETSRTFARQFLDTLIKDSSYLNGVYQYLALQLPGIKFKIDTTIRKTCICDTLLDNITANLLIDTSGGSITNPPPPKDPPVVPSGSSISNIDDNDKMAHALSSGISLTGKKFKIFPKTPITNAEKIMAFIDTGIDTALFTPNFSRLFWRLPVQTINNFLQDGSNENDFSDDNEVHHGSGVVAIGLSNYYKQNDYPRLMILKALGNNKGSVFTVSCALNYAIINNAALVNMSLGYKGKVDSILYSYVKKAKKANITLVVAAGNDPGTERKETLLCSTNPNTTTALDVNNQFFPACFTTIENNVISVTGLSSANIPCYYQNYSGEYITLGVMNTTAATPFSSNIEKGCCSYKPIFLNSFLEGSSFATPVVSGEIMNFIIKNGRRNSVKAYLFGIQVKNITTPGRNFSTNNGQFITY